MVVVLPEVIACACTTGTFCATTIVVVPLCMTDRATGSDVTPKGFHGCAHAQPEVGGFPAVFRVFSDMLCSTPRPSSHCVISKSTFDSLSHPIEGHSAFIQACDWLYIEAASTFFFHSIKKKKNHLIFFFFSFFVFFFFITHV